MKVLLIFKDSVAVERMAICYISSALKKAGNDVKLWIMNVNPVEQLHQYMSEYQPDIVGYSSMTGEHIPLMALNQELKEQYDFFSVFGGPHTTFAPSFIEEETSLDAACTGEGDLVFPELCRRMETGEKYWLTPTFDVRHEGKVYRNPLGDLTPTLELLDFPDRQILYDADPRLSKLGTKYFMAARGCPYKCSYCFNVKYNENYKGKGKVVRCRTPRQIIDEIKWVMERYPLDHVSFLDDLFILKPKEWLVEFSRLFKEEIGLQWSCTVRANTANLGGETTISMLSDSGLSWVWMGVESGDQKVANEILVRGLTNNEITAATQLLHKYNVGTIAQNLIGLPVSNPIETDLVTLDFNIALQPSLGHPSILYPYPGSPIEAYAREHGYLEGEPEYMETTKRSSMLKFPLEEDKRKLENLHHLFGIIVRFPILRPYVEFLISLPLTILYRAIFYLWYGYCFKIKLAKIKKLHKEISYFTGLFFRMLAKS